MPNSTTGKQKNRKMGQMRSSEREMLIKLIKNTEIVMKILEKKVPLSQNERAK